MNKLYITEGYLEFYKTTVNKKTIFKKDSFATSLRYGLPVINVNGIELFNTDLEYFINRHLSYVEIIEREGDNLIKFKIAGWSNIKKLCEELMNEKVRYSRIKKREYIKLGNYKVYENDNITIKSIIRTKVISENVTFKDLLEILPKSDFLKYINDNPQLKALNIKTY